MTIEDKVGSILIPQLFLGFIGIFMAWGDFTEQRGTVAALVIFMLFVLLVNNMMRK